MALTTPSSMADADQSDSSKPMGTIIRTFAIGESFSMTLAGWGVLAAVGWGMTISNDPSAALMVVVALWMSCRALGIGAGHLGTISLTGGLLIATAWMSLQDLSNYPPWLSRGPFSPTVMLCLLAAACVIDVIDFVHVQRAKRS